MCSNDKTSVDQPPDDRSGKTAIRPTGGIFDVFGLLKQQGGPTLTIDEINQTATEGWAGKR
jgi:hypothetical protein